MIQQKDKPVKGLPPRLKINDLSVIRMTQDIINAAIFAFDDKIVGSTEPRPITSGKNKCDTYLIVPHNICGFPGEIDYRIFRTIEHTILDRYLTGEVPTYIPLGSRHELLMNSLGYANTKRYEDLYLFAKRLTGIRVQYDLESESSSRGRIRKTRTIGADGIFSKFIFAGEMYDDGRIAEQIYVKLTDEYKKTIEGNRYKLAYKGVLDGIKSLTQRRLYELILLRDLHGAPKFSYPEICQYLHVTMKSLPGEIKKHVDRLLNPLKEIELGGVKMALVGDWKWIRKGITLSIPLALGHSPLLAHELDQAEVQDKIVAAREELTQIAEALGEVKLASEDRDNSTIKVRSRKTQNKKAQRDRQVGEELEKQNPEIYDKCLGVVIDKRYPR